MRILAPQMAELEWGDIAARVDRLELPFNAKGLDPYGTSKQHLARIFKQLWPFYRYYFRTRVVDIHNVPASGRAMIVCNHSGGYAIDAALMIGACFFDLEPPRLAQGMVEKFLVKMPFFASQLTKAGHFTGLPEHAQRLLEEERLIMVFPEGARGTAKLYKERHSLVRFGTGFVRLALQTRTPIVPAACIGGGDAVPTVANLYKLGRLFGVPYIPVTPYLMATPLPVSIQFRFGAPFHFEGSGDEDDGFINAKVEEVKSSIADLIEAGRRSREGE